ncbi:MAG: NAD(P) transhydrogenase subunit alpha [Nitriliruptoraceae bacterium]
MMGPLLVSLYVFVLAAFLGFELINKVPPTLHTPLMSGANAMSGITIIGALTLVTVAAPSVGVVFGVLALILATINVVGGFLVTDRLLANFGRRR